MTHTTLGVLAAAVWTAGIGATGALAYVARTPVPDRVQTVERPQTVAQIYERIPAPEPAPEVIALPNMDIVGAVPARARPSPSVHELHCTAWRPLQQGSNMVQMCE